MYIYMFPYTRLTPSKTLEIKESSDLDRCDGRGGGGGTIYIDVVCIRV